MYAITDYFQAQNDEDLPLLHWSFLIDITTNTEITGANLNDIHMNERATKIASIKRIIGGWGETTTSELELGSSPCLASIGTNKNNVSQLVEHFYADHVEVVTYQGEHELEWNTVPYEELPDEIIDEIDEIISDYEADMLRTEKRISD